MPMGGVALEVALQPAFLLGDGQLVIRQGEVVHADVTVAGLGQLLDGGLQHQQLFGRGEQVVGINAPLGQEARI